MIDSSAVKTHYCAGGGKGADAHPIGRSHGGRTTRVYAVTDAEGRLVRCQLSPGHAPQDMTMARPLLEGMTPSRSLPADKGHDSAELRRFLTERGTEPVIPNKRNRSRERFVFDPVAYRQ